MRKIEFDFDFNIEEGRYHLLYHTQPGEVLDTLCYKVMECNTEIPYLIPFSLEKEENSYVFRYDIAGTTNMMAWMDGISSKEEEKILEKIVQEVKALIQYQIPKEELLMERHFQYRDNCTGDIRFLCVPVKKGTEKPAQALHVPLPEIPPSPGNTSSFGDFKDYLNNRSFADVKEETFTDVEKSWLFADDDDDDEPFIETAEFPSFTEKREDRLFTDVENIKGDFEDKEVEDSGTVLLRRNADDDEGTVILQSIHGRKAELMRLRTQEVFQIRGNECKIGKKQSDTNICLRDNPTFSRLHCVIRYMSGDYYLEDLNSSNYTFLNGERILPGKQVKLPNTCKLQLANEEFMFRVM